MLESYQKFSAACFHVFYLSGAKSNISDADVTAVYVQTNVLKRNLETQSEGLAACV